MVTRAEASRLPADYRAIESAAQITRGDLAALIGVRLGTLLQVTRARDVGVMTDIRGHWAESWILAVARAGVLDPFANHTFQPRTVVRRVDFAQAMTRLLAKVAVVSPAQAKAWANARGRFTDIAAGHLAYPAASTAVAAGVMTAAPDGSFQPSRAVTGAEAIEAIEHLRAMANGVVESLTPVADERVHRCESADAAARHADSGLRDSRDLRAPRVGAGRVCDRVSHRRAGWIDGALVGTEEHARRVARSDGRQAARAEHVHRADRSVARPRQPVARSG